MMQRFRTSIFICAAAISPLCPAAAQSQQPESQPKQTTHIEVSYDLLGTGQRMMSSYGQYEAAVRYNIKDKYFPIIEAGIGTCDKEDETTLLRYETSAPYGRIGADMNILKEKHDHYRLYLGLRAAYTSFKYDVSSTAAITDPVWGTQTSASASSQQCSYLWAEIVAGVQARIVGPVYLGWSVRYKNRLSQSVPDAGEPWYVPGFGKRGSSRLGGTFNIIIAL